MLLINLRFKIFHMFNRLIKWTKRHKFLAGILAIIVIFSAYFLFFRSSGTPVAQYISGSVTRGTLAVSVTGSGQVSVSNQLDLKPKASGEVVWLGAKQGQFVGAGAAIAKLDSTDAEKAVRDAQDNLESAELAMEKLKASSADISKILENSFSDISNAFLDFPSIITSAENVIYGSNLNLYQDNIGYYKNFVEQSDSQNYLKDELLISSAASDYNSARAKYDAAFALYKTVTRDSDQATVQALLAQTYDTAKAIGQVLKSEQNLLDFLTDYGTDHSKTIPTLFTTYKSTIRTNIGLSNNHISSLSSDVDSVDNAPRDIKSQELSLKQKQNALADAQANLADYYLRAPFSGTLAQLDIKVGDSVSPSTLAGTLITNQSIAELSLNEVDVAKVKVAQKATLTFDAVPDLSIGGTVTRIDTIGTVSQGVVTYGVQITFDAQDSRVKPGMSVTAAIVTDLKTDALIVPASAVKLMRGVSYIEIQNPVTKAVTRQTVETGLNNDADIEIISGLKEGDSIIIRTINAGAVITPASAPSLFGNPARTPKR